MRGYASHFEIFHGDQQIISSEEKDILDFIWKSFLKTGEAVPEQVLSSKFPAIRKPHSEDNPWTRLQNRRTPPPFDVKEWHGYRGFAPNFYGVLLSSRGQQLEKLLVRYTAWLQQVAKDPMPTGIVTGKQVAKALKLTKGQAFELCQLAIKAGFAPIPLRRQSLGSWRLFLPYDIRDIMKVVDLSEFVVDRALGRTNPPWSPSFKKKFSRFGAVARQRMRVHGIGDEAFMEEPEEAAKLDEKLDSGARARENRKVASIQVPLEVRKAIRQMMDAKQPGAKKVAADGGVGLRTLYRLTDGAPVYPKTIRALADAYGGDIPQLANLAKMAQLTDN